MYVMFYIYIQTCIFPKCQVQSRNQFSSRVKPYTKTDTNLTFYTIICSLGTVRTFVAQMWLNYKDNYIQLALSISAFLGKWLSMCFSSHLFSSFRVSSFELSLLLAAIACESRPLFLIGCCCREYICFITSITPAISELSVSVFVVVAIRSRQLHAVVRRAHLFSSDKSWCLISQNNLQQSCVSPPPPLLSLKKQSTDGQIVLLCWLFLFIVWLLCCSWFF